MFSDLPAAALRLAVALAALAGSAAPHAQVPAEPLVHTYSIVARDPDTGELGVAVQSHWFSVGSVVPWAEAGVGAVATQAFADPSYGKLGLDLMRAGRSAPDALAGLLAADAGRDVRQVAMVDAGGRVAAHTGARNIAAAGHHVGKEYSVQANLMERDTVWAAMARAFESTKGDLAGRMLAALEAAEAERGDIRGKQSAALLVVSGKPSGKPWTDRVFDLRVDDSADPLGELRRLVQVRRAYIALAAKAFDQAASLYPQNPEMLFWHAVELVNARKVDEALPLFARVFRLDPRWRELPARIAKSGLIPDDPALLERIARQAPR